MARKDENAENLKSINSDLRRDLENLDLQNQELKYSESAMKGELSSLKSELTSLGIEESRISEQLIGLRGANEKLLEKTENLERENDGMKMPLT